MNPSLPRTASFGWSPVALHEPRSLRAQTEKNVLRFETGICTLAFVANKDWREQVDKNNFGHQHRWNDGIVS